MKNVIGVILSLIVLGALTGCGGSISNTGSTTVPTSSTVRISGSVYDLAYPSAYSYVLYYIEDNDSNPFNGYIKKVNMNTVMTYRYDYSIQVTANTQVYITFFKDYSGDMNLGGTPSPFQDCYGSPMAVNKSMDSIMPDYQMSFKI
jgi:hypothetical protein